MLHIVFQRLLTLQRKTMVLTGDRCERDSFKFWPFEFEAIRD